MQRQEERGRPAGASRRRLLDDRQRVLQELLRGERGVETVLELRCMRGVRVDYLLLHQPGWTLAAVRRLAARPGPAYMLSGRVCALSASSREDLCRLVREERVWARAVGVCPRCGACSSLETPEERPCAHLAPLEWWTREQVASALRDWQLTVDHHHQREQRIAQAPWGAAPPEPWLWPPHEAVVALFGSWLKAEWYLLPYSDLVRTARLSMHEMEAVIRHRSTEELLATMRLWVTRYERVPSQRAWNTHCVTGRQPNAATYCKRFGDWPSALAAAGIALTLPTRYGDREVLASMRTWNAGIAAQPTARRWDRTRPAGTPNSSYIRGRFGSWPAALTTAGIQHPRRGRQRYWTRERILAALHHWERTHGRAPTQQELTASNRRKHGHRIYPPYNAVVQQFGSWTAGLRAAGLTPRSNKRTPPTRAS